MEFHAVFTYVVLQCRGSGAESEISFSWGLWSL